MTTFVLEPDGAVLLPAAPVTVRAAVISGPPVRVRALSGGQVLTAGRPGQVVNGLVQNQPGALTVAKLLGPLTIEVASLDGQPLPSGSVVTLTVGSESVLVANAQSAMIQHVDTSGAAAVEVLQLSAQAGQIEVRATYDPTPPMTGRLGAVIAATREFLGAHDRGRDPKFRLLLAVDDSASMRIWSRSGVVAALVDLLAGINHVLGRERLLVHVEHWRAVETAEASSVVASSLAGRALGSSYVVADQPSMSGRMVLITDEPGGWPTAVLPLVVCAASASDLLPIAENGAVAVACSSPERWVDELDRDPGLLAQLVATLVPKLSMPVQKGGLG